MRNFLSGLTAGSCLFLIWHLLKDPPYYPRPISKEAQKILDKWWRTGTPMTISGDRTVISASDFRGGIGRSVIGKEDGDDRS